MRKLHPSYIFSGKYKNILQKKKTVFQDQSLIDFTEQFICFRKYNSDYVCPPQMIASK